jgi:GTP-sensing pleiotropic transcriptional regulator CodY
MLVFKVLTMNVSIINKNLAVLRRSLNEKSKNCMITSTHFSKSTRITFFGNTLENIEHCKSNLKINSQYFSIYECDYKICFVISA